MARRAERRSAARLQLTVMPPEALPELHEAVMVTSVPTLRAPRTALRAFINGLEVVWNCTEFVPASTVTCAGTPTRLLSDDRFKTRLVGVVLSSVTVTVSESPRLIVLFVGTTVCGKWPD